MASLHGTPCYAYDMARLQWQIEKLRQGLPPEVEVFYSLKANPAPALCQRIAQEGMGADVVSIGELLVALNAGFPSHRIQASGPWKSPEMLERLCALPEAAISVDSVSELRELSRRGVPHRLLLRLRPDFPSGAAMKMGAGSRFGISFEELLSCHEVLADSDLRVAGFHVFAGSQVLDAAAIVRHLRQSLELTLRAADVLQREPKTLNLGGGFGIPYGAGQPELDLEPIRTELEAICRQAAPGRIVLEIGRYLVAQSGWYLTRVVASQTVGGRTAVVVDGGTHQRADLCGLHLRTRAFPPLAFLQRQNGSDGSLKPTDVLGCLCLSEDVLSEESLLPALAPGDLLAFPNAGAYGLSASPILFLGHPSPAEVVFEDSTIKLVRERQTAHATSLVPGSGREGQPWQ